MIVSQSILFRRISEAVKKRLPTENHLHMGGLMTLEECEKFKEISATYNISLYAVPTLWACSLLDKAYQEKRIKDKYGFVRTLREISDFRSSLGTLSNYDWITVPLVYTQVVTLAVYTFALASLMAAQIDMLNDQSIFIHLLHPLFVFLQFLFYMGWLKVAEVLINPMGCDDDDFELNYIIDRNIKVGYLTVDKNQSFSSKLEEEPVWKGSKMMFNENDLTKHVKPVFRGSVANLKIPLEKQREAN